MRNVFTCSVGVRQDEFSLLLSLTSSFNALEGQILGKPGISQHWQYHKSVHRLSSLEMGRTLQSGEKQAYVERNLKIVMYNKKRFSKIIKSQTGNYSRDSIK